MRALGVAAAAQPFRVIVLPAGNYARLRHIGSYAGLQAAIQHVVAVWLPAWGWEPVNFPHFLSDPNATPLEKLETDILLPLAPQQQAST